MASLRFIAAQNPTIGLASVMTKPLNLSCFRSKSFKIFGLNVAGISSPVKAGKAICPTMTALVPKSINSL